MILLFVILVAEFSEVDVKAQRKAVVKGIVIDEDGVHIGGANVTLLDFDHRSFVKRVTTDSAGRFYVSVNREGSYLIYVTYDDRKTPGVDYVPERWRTWLSSDSVSSRKFILKKGASIYLDGEIRYIKTSKVAISYQFTVLGLKGSDGKDYWTGPVGDYGSFSDLVQFLGFDERLVVVPAETKVKIQVRANFPARQSQTFVLAGKTGYFRLLQGEAMHIDVREHNILSNVEYLKGILSSGFSLLDDCLTAGFLVAEERRDLFKAYNLVEESLFLLRKGLLDQSFARLRSAYILATRTEGTLKGLIESSSQSLFPLLFLFLFVAFASAHLVTENSVCLDVTAGDRRFLISVTSLVETALYFLLFAFFYLVYPGSHLIPQSTYISMGVFIFLAGKAVMFLFPWFAREEEGGNQPIQLKSAVVAAFSMGSRNLRRRKMRTLMNLISVMVLVFGFITLTSISPGYGLSKIELRPILPVDALLIKDESLGGSPGSFVSLPDSFIRWLESYPNVTLISPKAENSPVTLERPLGRLYSATGKRMDVLGVIGVIPSKEANLTGLNQILEEGDYLEDDDLKGILISSSLRELLEVDVGDKLYGFGQEFIVRGFFERDALTRFLDINGQTYLPYYSYHSPEGEVVNAPCPSDAVIILAYEKAITLPKVSTSRVAVQLSDIGGYESLARIIVLTYEYRVYDSHPGFLAMYSLGEYIEERGTGLVFPIMVLVMLNIGLSMFAAVNERRNEIATFSSLGLNPAHIAALFVAETLIIGFIGGGFGYLLGISGYRLASLLGGLQVREKVSAEWGITSILFSVATAVVASLIPALRSSTLATPSLLRRWNIEENERPIGSDKPWALDIPIKLMPKELEPFTAFIVRQLRAHEVKLEEESYEGGMVRKISFMYDLPEMGWTKNEIVIQPEEKEYSLKLVSSSHGSSQPAEAIRMTATYVRKLVLEWSAATCEVVTSFDPSLSRLYNIVDTYSPTTLYVISAYPDTNDKIDEFRDKLVSRGIRPPKFAVSRVTPGDLEQIIKTVKDLVSRADIVCVSGEDALLCSALAMEAVKQNKSICYVIDDRSIEERMKNPFQELKIIRIS
jgi:ABC-type lipoprotein release transport system permease subunit